MSIKSRKVAEMQLGVISIKGFVMEEKMAEEVL